MQDIKRVTLHLPTKTSFHLADSKGIDTLKDFGRSLGYDLERTVLDYCLCKTNHSSIYIPENSSSITITVRGSDLPTKLTEALDKTIKLAIFFKLGLPRVNPRHLDEDALLFYAEKLVVAFPNESNEYVKEIKDFVNPEDDFVNILSDPTEEAHVPADDDLNDLEDAHTASPTF